MVKAGRHRQTQVGHLGEVRPLAAEQVLHAGAALRLAAAEDVDPLAFRAGPGCAFALLLAEALRFGTDLLFLRDDGFAIQILAVAIRVLVTLSRRFLNRLFLCRHLMPRRGCPTQGLSLGRPEAGPEGGMTN
jgi:hypothetical protein